MQKLIALAIVVLALAVPGAVLLGGPLGTLVTHFTESDSDRMARAALQSIAIDRAQALADIEISKARADAARENAQKNDLLAWSTVAQSALLVLVPVLII